MGLTGLKGSYGGGATLCTLEGTKLHLRGGKLDGDGLGRLGRHILPVAADHDKRWVVARKGEVHRSREHVSERDLFLPSRSDSEGPLVILSTQQQTWFSERGARVRVLSFSYVSHKRETQIVSTEQVRRSNS